MGPSVDHVERVELTDRSGYSGDGHGIVGLYQEGRVCEAKYNHIVDVVKVVERVDNCSILPGDVDLKSGNLSVGI